MNEQQFFKERTEANALVQTVQRYLPFWPLFLITIAMSLAVAHVYLRSQSKVYQAAGKVLLKDPNRNGSDSKVLDALNIFGEKKIVENEIVVLRSSGIMQEVVKRLNLYTSVYNEGRVRTEELYGGNSPVTFITAAPDSATFAGKHYFSVNWQKGTFSMDGQTIALGGSIRVGDISYRVVPTPTYNHSVTGKNYFVMFNGVEGTAASLSNALTAAAISNQSTVIDVKLQTGVPQKGKDILNTLFEVYNEAAIEDKNQTAAKTLAFIENRLHMVIAQLDSVERGVKDYKSRNNVYDLSSQAQLYLDNVKDLDKDRSQVDLQLEVLAAIETYINNKDGKKGTVPSLMMVQDPSLASLLQKLYDAEFALEKARGSAGERSDVVIAATETVAQLKGDIRENMASLRTNLLTAKSTLNNRIGANNSLLQSVPQKEIGLIDISRQQAIKNNIYTFLLQKREETALNSASTIADLRVIEKATAGGPISPVPKNYYIGGFLVGLLIAAGFVMFREQLNRKVLFRQEIEAKTTVPVIAEIAQIQSTGGSVVITEGKRTAIAEQFRSLRTNLTFMGVGEGTNTILVTSSVSGEGKSFTAINLALSFTLTGKAVGLLELDLRKPKISKLLGLSRDPGISNYLINQASFTDIIKPTAHENLFVLSSGPVPPNPSELLLKARFKELMKEARAHFDYVIIDTAPIGPVTDAFLLKDMVDATIFVVRHDVTPKVYLKLIDDLKQQAKFRNLSIVFNGLKRRGFSYYGYGYGGYGSGYGYGYGYGYGSSYYNTDEKNGKVRGLKARLFKTFKLW